MATMTVMFDVDVTDSGSVMQALAPCMGVLRNFCMEVKENTRPKRYASPRGSKVEDTIMAALKASANGPVHKNKLGEELSKIGLSANSVSPAVSGLEKAGKVRRVRDGMVELVK